MEHESRDVIRTQGLVKTFGKGDVQVRALDGVNLRVSAGSVFGLLGANGSGKTTLIRTLTTMARPTAGRAWVNGVDVAAEPARVRRLIGVTSQHTSLDDRLSGAENLRIIGRLHGMRRSQARRTADDLLEQYSLTHAAARAVSTYSGGMRRRLDIVSSLIRRPPVLFLDEPSTGLDPRSRAEIWGTVRQLAEAGTSVLLTTQYLDEADQLADRVAVLAAGSVIAEGPTHELKARIGQRLTVTLHHPRDRDAARAALAALGVTGMDQTDPTPADDQADDPLLRGHIDPGTGPLPLPRLLHSLTGVGVEVADIGLSDPTLDEAYLALTEENV